jgi:hypothetical protein
MPSASGALFARSNAREKAPRAEIYKNAFHHGAPLCRYLSRSTVAAAAAPGFFAGVLARAAGFGAAGVFFAGAAFPALRVAAFTVGRARVALAARPRPAAVVGRVAFFFEERDELLVVMQAFP